MNVHVKKDKIVDALASEQKTRSLAFGISPHLPLLNADQCLQIARQIIAHDHDEYIVPIELSAHKAIEIVTHRHVLQPMSSKLLAQFIFKNSAIFDGKSVYDIGTGTGVQAIAAGLSGAKHVLCTDISDYALTCADHNLSNYLDNDSYSLVSADLMSSKDIDGAADAIVFAQPYFGDNPLADYNVTTGMLNNTQLIKRFFDQCDVMLSRTGKVLMMSWDFAGPTNNPCEYIGEHSKFEIELTETFENKSGIQSGDFHIHVLRRKAP